MYHYSTQPINQTNSLTNQPRLMSEVETPSRPAAANTATQLTTLNDLHQPLVNEANRASCLTPYLAGLKSLIQATMRPSHRPTHRYPE